MTPLCKCNDPMIGSYNNYHLSSNGIPRGSQRWHGLVYFVYKNAGSPWANWLGSHALVEGHVFNSPRRQSYFMRYMKCLHCERFKRNRVGNKQVSVTRIYDPWAGDQEISVTLLKYPSYITFTGKVILELTGRWPHILWALRCSWAHTHQRGEAPRLRKGGPNMLLN